MAEDKIQPRGVDRKDLDVDDAEQMRDWAKKWDVSEQWVRAAEAKVGHWPLMSSAK